MEPEATAASPSSNPFLLEIGCERFCARPAPAQAPRAEALLTSLLPYAGAVLHARWSGEALWSPLAGALPTGTILPPESAVDEPRPGEILLYAGDRSEPELLLPYGRTRFACDAGPLAGAPVLLIDEGLDRLARLGREVLWQGARELHIAAGSVVA